MMKCPHCGASAVAWENYDVQEDDASQHVCQDCGAVLEEGSFRNDFAQDGGYQGVSKAYLTSGVESTSLPQGYVDSLRSVAPRVHVLGGVKTGERKIQHLFQYIGASEAKLWAVEALDLFKCVLERSSYILHQSTSKKEVAAGVCVMIVCRNHDMPITSTFISMLLGCDMSAFAAELRLVRKSMDIEVKPLVMDNYVESICSKQQTECIERTKQVLAVAEQTWITHGCPRDSLVMAANFIAWQSLDISRRKMTLKGYLKQQDYKHTVAMTRRYSELVRLLCTLCAGVPWLSKCDINKNNVSVHVKDIISYQKTLFYEAEKDMNDKSDSSGQTSNDTSMENTKEEKSNVAAKKRPYQERSEHDKNEPPSKRPSIFLPRKSGFSKFRERYHVEDTRAEVFHPNMDSEILGEDDIPESELVEYVKQEHEVITHLQLQGTVKREENV